jgi:hypothetical protein
MGLLMAERKSILLRLSRELWEELNRWARDDLRSLNAQIEYLLRSAVSHRRRGNNEPTASRGDDEERGST